MSKIFHTVTDTIGLTDYAGQEAAATQANADRALAEQNANRAYNISKEEIKFQREQYNDWKNIYGPLQEDLGTYFKNLTGDAKAAQQIVAIQAESQRAQNQIDTQLAQRGLDQSGMQAELLNNNLYATAMSKANARANADTQAAQEKMGFLGIGLGQGTQMLSINAQASGSAINSATSIAGMWSGSSNSQSSLAQRYSSQNQDTIGTLGGVVMKKFGF